jgi:hypothetical protein
MPAPAKSKVWQFNVNSAQYGATLADTMKAVMFKIKSSLIGFSTLPWSVVGSSNSSTSGMDGTDRWSTAANLVWNTGGSAHSWIVLKQAGLNTNFSICIDLSNASTYLATVVVSPVNGFGTANGGTNGSTTARPTATDEIVSLNNANWAFGATNSLCQVHCMQSTDGKCTRVILCTGGYHTALWMFDAVNNAVPGWTGTNAYFSAIASGTTNTGLEYYVYQDQSSFVYFRHSTTTGNFYMGSLGYVSTSFGRQLGGKVAHDVLKEWPFCPIYLWSETPYARGYFGNPYDLYYGSATHGVTGLASSSTSYDSAGLPFNWVQIGHFIFPWNGSSPVITG